MGKLSYFVYEKENENAIPRRKILCERKAATIIKNKATTKRGYDRNNKVALYDSSLSGDTLRLINLSNNAGNVGSTQSPRRLKGSK